jgi:hypothetical protein
MCRCRFPDNRNCLAPSDHDSFHYNVCGIDYAISDRILDAIIVVPSIVTSLMYILSGMVEICL